MCGRFSLRLSSGEIRQVAGNDVDVDEWVDEDQFVPRYNIAPRTQAPVLRRRDPGSSDSRDRTLILQTMKWGLVPHWSKFEDTTLSTTNARSENLVEGGGMWAGIKGKKRCAVLCQGYYEWLARGKVKLPHFIRHQGEKLMLMAGLYDCVMLEGQNAPLWTFTIATTAANEDFNWLHDRQPVILSTREALEQWLDTSSQKWTPELTKLVRPYHDSTSSLICYQVPKEVGKVGTESPTFIEPISNRKDGIEAMFSKQKQLQNKTAPIPASGIRWKRHRSHSPTTTCGHTTDSTRFAPPKKRKPEEKPIKVDNKSDVTKEPLSTPKKVADTYSKFSPSKDKSPKRSRKKDASSESSTKITTFFNQT